jgi:hypothetical protein
VGLYHSSLRVGVRRANGGRIRIMKTELNGYPVAAGHRLQSLLRMPVVFSPKLNHASWQTERKNTLRAIIDPCKVKARREIERSRPRPPPEAPGRAKRGGSPAYISNPEAESARH